MNYLKGLPLLCRGEESGSCDDLYFEDGTWRLRYLLALDGGFVLKKRSLVSPESIDRVTMSSNPHELPLSISKEALDSAPAHDSELPFSREIEQAVLSHYHLDPYWLSGPIGGEVGVGAGHVVEDPPRKSDLPVETKSNLRSLEEVLGYDIKNDEVPLGKVCDLILDITDMSVAYLAVDTKPSDRGGVRLISTTQEDNKLSIDYASGTFRTACSSYHLLESPSADLSEGRLSLGDQQKVEMSAY